jgi:hypothetical protein
MFATNIFNIAPNTEYELNIDTLYTTILVAAAAAVGGAVLASGVSSVLTRGGITGTIWSLSVFGGLFWGIWGATSNLLGSIMGQFPGFTIMWTVFSMLILIIFIMALIQMITGGQKSHV